jgi:hypothetical protein
MMLAMSTCVGVSAIYGGQVSHENGGCDAYAGLKLPDYKIGKVWRNNAGLVLNVSVRGSDVERGKVLALLCKLGRAHADEEFLWINVLDSARAAKRYVFGGEGNDRETNMALRAQYAFFRGQGGIQVVTWFPDRYDLDRSIRIELGEPPPTPSTTR